MVAVNVELVLGQSRLASFFLLVCNLLWPRSLDETSDKVKWDSPIAK